MDYYNPSITGYTCFFDDVFSSPSSSNQLNRLELQAACVHFILFNFQLSMRSVSWKRRKQHFCTYNKCLLGMAWLNQTTAHGFFLLFFFFNCFSHFIFCLFCFKSRILCNKCLNTSTQYTHITSVCIVYNVNEGAYDIFLRGYGSQVVIIMWSLKRFEKERFTWTYKVNHEFFLAERI